MNAANSTNNSVDHEEVDDSEQQEEEVSDVAKSLLIVLYISILLGSFVGNFLILHLVRTRKNIRKNPFNWLLVNTAAADLLDVVTASAFTLPYYICGTCWFPGLAGVVLCKLIPYILVVSICVTVLTLTVIAVDRYLAIVCLKKKPLSSKSVVLAIIGVWLFAGVLFSGEFHKFRVGDREEGGVECYPDWYPDSEDISIALYKAEMVVRVVVTYAIPLPVMAVMYSLIAWFLWRHKPPGDVNQVAVARQGKKTRLVIKMLVIAVTVFALGWLPVHVNHIMVEFHNDAFKSIPTVVRWLFYWLAHANTAIHPWLFITFSENFREETKRMFRNVWRKSNLRSIQANTSTSSQPSLLINYERSLPKNAAPAGFQAINLSTITLDTKL